MPQVEVAEVLILVLDIAVEQVVDMEVVAIPEEPLEEEVALRQPQELQEMKAVVLRQEELEVHLQPASLVVVILLAVAVPLPAQVEMATAAQGLELVLMVQVVELQEEQLEQMVEMARMAQDQIVAVLVERVARELEAMVDNQVQAPVVVMQLQGMVVQENLLLLILIQVLLHL